MSELFIIKELISIKEMSLKKSSSLLKQALKLRSNKMSFFRLNFMPCVSHIIGYIRYAIDKELVDERQRE
jgi:hypothetical protein